MRTKTAGHLIKNDKIKKQCVNFTNTCGFDSYISCLCSSYASEKQTNDQQDSNIINTNTEQLVQFLKEKGHTHKAEALKQFILTLIFEETEKKFKMVDCNNNVCFFVDKLNQISYQITKTCPCGEKKNTYPFIYLNALENFKSIKTHVTPTQKIKCGKGHIYKIHLKFNNSICLTTNIFNEKNKLDPLNNNIPDKLYIEDSVYKLKCFVNFKPPKVQAGIGHYQAYCRNPLDVWEVYDNSSLNILKMEKFVIPHLFVYTNDF